MHSNPSAPHVTGGPEDLASAWWANIRLVVESHDPKLDELVRRLAEALGPERIYLFGSRARGDADPDSDYDLMVVVADSELPGYRRDQIAYRALRGVGVAKDVMVWTRDEFDRRRHLAASLPATIIREGRLIYGG